VRSGVLPHLSCARRAARSGAAQPLPHRTSLTLFLLCAYLRGAFKTGRRTAPNGLPQRDTCLPPRAFYLLRAHFRLTTAADT